MANLNTPMANEEIRKLDYFDKMQLYYNVYYDTPYESLPTALREVYTKDDGLELVQSIILNSNLKNPFAINKLIKAIGPNKPQTFQEIYARAQYLAKICETTPRKILESSIFNSKDFIPQMNEETINKVISGGALGMPVTLKPTDYTPAPDTTPDDGGSSGGGAALTGDYADETKIYFNVNGTNVTCNVSYNEVLKMLPKLPAAELVLNKSNDYQNITDISCGYNEVSGVINFNFIQLYEANMKLYTVHYSASSLTLEENQLIISSNLA